MSKLRCFFQFKGAIHQKQNTTARQSKNTMEASVKLQKNSPCRVEKLGALPTVAAALDVLPQYPTLATLILDVMYSPSQRANPFTRRQLDLAPSSTTAK